jgi:mono/diheme cytochrome c family protein
LAALAAGIGGFAAAAAAQSDLVARGAYLTNALATCGNCHTPRNPDGSPQAGKAFAGGFEFVDPVLGTVYSRNITPDKDTGIGSWTDDQIVRAIREGVNREGEVLMPPMPVNTFNHMSDDDVRAIVAYLRTVPAVRNEVPQDRLKVPRGGQPGAAAGTAAPPRGPTVAYGRYLLTAMIDCMECHTTPGPQGAPDFAGHLGAGGFRIAAFGLETLSANITQDKATGIGDWSDADIKRAITEGVIKDHPWPIFPAMPAPMYKTMTPDDLDAIVAFVKTLPPVANAVPRKDWRPAGPPPGK